MLQVERDAMDERVLSIRQDLENGLLPLGLYNDPDIAESEIDRIFMRCWVFVGHESEIPGPGDYCIRYIGDDPFILVRDERGGIQLLLDLCRHRGTQICRAEKGNASHFRCPYHGWTYKNSGELVGIPFRENGFADLDTNEWGLIKAAKVQSYEGLVFATLDDNAQDLEEYLGDLRWYLDSILKLTEWEVVGEPQRTVMDVDWKVMSENSAGDGYHVMTTHKSAIDLNLEARSDIPHNSLKMGHIGQVSGHALHWEIFNSDTDYFCGYQSDVKALFKGDRISKTQFDFAKRTLGFNAYIFPNLSLISYAGISGIDRPKNSYFILRLRTPRGPGKLEEMLWQLVPKGASPTAKDLLQKNGITHFTPAGNLEEDDISIVTGITRGALSKYARKINMKLSYQMGDRKNSGTGGLTKGWPGPGVSYDNSFTDVCQRTFWSQWCRWMMSRPKPLEPHS